MIISTDDTDDRGLINKTWIQEVRCDLKPTLVAKLCNYNDDLFPSTPVKETLK